MDEPGVTVLEPEAGTVPRPLMLMSVAFPVCQVSVVVCPCSMTAGFAASVAVGVGGAGGGGGGVACAVFLLQPASDNAPARIIDNVKLLH